MASRIPSRHEGVSVKRILHSRDLNQLYAFLAKKHKSIVLVGGCFDIIHIGHIKFLQEAKKHADVLVVLLESDEKVQKLKGKNRPLFKVEERAEVLSSLKPIDYVVILPMTKSDSDYEKLILQIHPSVIAVTEHDPLIVKKRSHAIRVGAKLVIIPHINTHSTSSLAQMLGIN